jgi:hypothetical protein
LAIQGEVSDLQTDNVKLYEKIRFLQGFQVWLNCDSEYNLFLLFVVIFNEKFF